MGMVTCPQCRKQVPVSEVRYTSPDDYVCKECATPVKDKVPQSSSEEFDISPEGKKVLVCENCSFENKVKKSVEGASCSYCGGSDLHPDGTRAAELIAEVDNVDTTK